MEEREWSEYERRVVDTVKWCEERNESPLVWTMEVAKLATRVPSPELGQVLVSHLCFLNNRPSLWKFLEQSLSSGLLYPLQVLSLLSARVIPNRRSQPEAYNLYLELLSRYGLSFAPLPPEAAKEKIIKSVDLALRLSQTYNVPALELGHVIVLFFFTVVVGVIDSIIYDWGLQKSLDVSSLACGSNDGDDMDIDSQESHNLGRKEHRGELRSMNSLKALEVLGKLIESRKAVLLLRLVHFNMPEKFNGLLRRLELLRSHSLASPDLNPATQFLEIFSANIQRVVDCELCLDKRQLIGMLIANGSSKPVSLSNFESGHSGCWVALDICMENTIDGKQLPIKSTIDVLAEVIVTLQILNEATWQETFLALWLSALRLVQRERDPVEGPVPHLEARLCVLLSIVPLAICKVLEDGTPLCSSSHPETVMSGYEIDYGHSMSAKTHCPRKHGLIASLQVLGQFSALLCPPLSVVGEANIAVTKAAQFLHNSRNEKDHVDCGNHGQGFIRSGGNVRHLIVEACIARNLIDTSAYFWPGYVPASAITPSDTSPLQKSPWSTFMEGAPLSGTLINSLVTTPASSLAEIEKLYHTALHGSEEEKSAAAKILCGASLRSGWNIQEHVVHIVVKLLSPPVPPNYKGERSHLVDYMPMLSAILYGLSSVDTVHILTLHGVDWTSGKTIGSAKELNGLYHLEDKFSERKQASVAGGPVNSVSRTQKIMQLHFRLGHPSFSYMCFLFPSMFQSNDLFQCEICQLAKHKHISFSSHVCHAFKPFTLIHNDVWGPSRVSSLTNKKWFVTFTDDHTRVCWVYLFKEKSEVGVIFQQFHSMIKTQFNESIKLLCTDNGKEYFNSVLGNFMIDNGIIHHSTCVDTPQQNGVLERKNRHLLEVARALLFTVGLPKRFWGDAILIACYLINRMPSRVLNFKTPLDFLYQTYPNLR